MSRGKTLVIILLFAGLNLAKQLLPEQSLLLRERVTTLVERDSDYGALAETLGRELLAEDPERGLIAAFRLSREKSAADPEAENTEKPEMEPMPGESL